MEKRLENLSTERLDEDFVEAFQAIHIQQLIFGSLNVKIKHGFVTPPSKLYILYCMAMWMINLLGSCAFILQCEIADEAILEDVFIKIGQVIHLCTFFLVFIRNVFLKKNAFSAFYVKLQKLDRVLNMDSRVINKNMARFGAYVSMGLIVLGAILMTSYNLVLNKGFCPYAPITLLPGLANCIDMLLCFFIMYFVMKRLQYINDKVMDIELTKGELRTVDRSQKDIECTWDTLLLGFESIITILSDFIDLFQCQIFMFTCQVMIWSIIIVQCVIHKFKYQIHVSTKSIVYVFVILIMLCTFIGVLCRLSVLLSHKKQYLKKTCSDLSSRSQDISSQYAKRMLLLLEVDTKLTIYDIYTLNSRLPFQLFAIIATYTIILLQFAML